MQDKKILYKQVAKELQELHQSCQVFKDSVYHWSLKEHYNEIENISFYEERKLQEIFEKLNIELGILILLFSIRTDLERILSHEDYLPIREDLTSKIDEIFLNQQKNDQVIIQIYRNVIEHIKREGFLTNC